MSFSLLNKHIVQSFQTSWLLYFEIKIQIQASESEKLISLVFSALAFQFICHPEKLINHSKARNAIEIDGAYVPDWLPGCRMWKAGCAIQDVLCKL